METGRIDTMSTIKITTISCVREQDFSGLDEPRLYIAGQQVWDGKMNKGDSVHPNVSRPFSNSVLVELKEQNNNKSEKSLGKWTIPDTPTQAGNPALTATSSGYDYRVYFDVY
jgi:hypothetical protein